MENLKRTRGHGSKPVLALVIAAALAFVPAVSWSAPRGSAAAWGAAPVSVTAGAMPGAAPAARESGDGTAGPGEIRLDLVPEHFRGEILQARSLLPALLEQAPSVLSVPVPAPAAGMDEVSPGGSQRSGGAMLSGSPRSAAPDPASDRRWPEAPLRPDAPFRPELSLDGTWSYYAIEQGELAPAPEGRQVPQEFDGPRTAWYAVRFTVPESWRGQRIYLWFEGVTIYAEVYVNGAFAGAHGGRFTPFEVDITEHVRIGEENLLHVLNASAALAYEPRRRAMYYQVGGTTELERLELTPDLPQSAGIWGSVTLSARHPVHVVDQYVVPSVREQKLTAEVTLANRTGESRRIQVVHRLAGATDETVRGPVTAPQELTLAPWEERGVTVEIPWPDPVLWDLENPFLYWFTTELSAGGETLDRRSVRFGFREFWIEGPHFVLNGSKVRLMGESGVWPKWDPRPGEDTPRPGRPWTRHDRPGVEALYRAYKAMNMTAVRLHYRIASRVEIEVADELGILLIPQSGIWTAAEPYERGGATFFGNLEREFEEWIKRDRNSPSVVVWDVDNEILRWGTPWQRPWALRLEQIVERYDRSRALLHSGGGKFGDAAQAYSFHMAENYDLVFRAWGEHPDKPVILGEWWIGRQVHHGGGMLVPYGWSDRSYGVDLHHIARRERIEMHRMAGVHTMPFDFDRSLIYPALPMSGGRVSVDSRAAALYRDAFAPLFVSVKERGTTALAGERLSRTAVVLNDTPRDLDVRFAWRLRAGTALVDQGEAMLRLANGEKAEIPIELIMTDLPLDDAADVAPGAGFAATPHVGEVTLELEVQAGAYHMANEQRIFVLSPALLQAPEPLEPFLVYDPEGKLRLWLDAQGIPYRALDDLSSLAQARGPALIVGRNGLATLPREQAAELAGFVQKGGRALIMEQETRLPVSQAWHHPGVRLATPWLPHGLAFWSADIAVPYNVQTFGVPARSKDVLMSRYAAILRRNHPVVSGLPSQLIAHWRAGDGRVVDDAIQIPGGVAAPPAGVTPIVGVVGPDNASLVEAEVGEGFYLINQLEVTENLGVDPVATLLFINMLRRLEPEVVAVQLPTGLASGTLLIPVEHYAPAGWRFRRMRLWVDDDVALAVDQPLRRLEVDTRALADGDRRIAVEVEYETPEGLAVFRAGGEVVVSNWRRFEDELLPPREGWFGSPIKQLKTESESAGWRFVASNPARYFGDAHRMIPGTAGVPDQLVWRIPRIQRFQVIVYAEVDAASSLPGPGASDLPQPLPGPLAGQLAERLTLSASANRESWHTLPYRAKVTRASAPDERGAVVLEIAVAGEAPIGVEATWFAVTMANPAETMDAWQLGKVELWSLR